MVQRGQDSSETTWEVAAAQLLTFGITEASLIDVYHRYGGTVLGLELLKRTADHCGLFIPSDIVLNLEEVSRLSPVAMLKLIPDSLFDGFAIKYSGHLESFSPDCRRGKNSSRRRFWDGTDQAAAVRLLEGAVPQAPPMTRSLVLQQYIVDPGLSGVFYAYGYDGRTMIEACSAGERTVTDVQAGRITQHFRVTGEHIRSGSARHADPLCVDRCLQALRARVGFDLDLEGFASDTGVAAVQLRPIPNDMPRLLEQPHIQNGHVWHRTPLVWGVWMNGATKVGADIPGRPAVMLKQAVSLAECPLIMRRLERGDPTLVIDVVDGFRLSHDPKHLPEVVAHREPFAYISVAGTSLASLQPGDHIEAFVDGDTGMIRRIHHRQ